MSGAHNIVKHNHIISREQRETKSHHKAVTLWFTGLSGSGKSTIASEVEKQLWKKNHNTYLLDGDNVRHGLCKDLGFSEEDRNENIRRIGEVAKLFVDANVICLTAFISPYLKDRDQVRALFAEGDFVEVFIDCPLNICEKRDPKGLYKKARAGIIKNFTGIDDPYEKPLNPEITINATLPVEECAQQIVSYIEKRIGGKKE